MKRFYTSAQVRDSEAGYALYLDDKPIRTPSGGALQVPSRPLAEAIAQEWNAAEETVNPAALRFTKMSNTALERTGPMHANVVSEIVNYAQTDLICYRAERPDPLVVQQSTQWDPVLKWLKDTLHIELTATTALMGHSQSQVALDTLEAHISDYEAFSLTGLHAITTSLGSVSLALAHVHGFLDAEPAWAAASVDEAFQMAEWGQDAEALEALQARKDDFLSASLFWHSCKDYT